MNDINLSTQGCSELFNASIIILKIIIVIIIPTLFYWQNQMTNKNGLNNKNGAGENIITIEST